MLRLTSRLSDVGFLTDQIASYCWHESKKQSGNRMRRLIKTGLASGSLPLTGGPCFRSVATINGILENCAQTRFFDFRFLRNISGYLPDSIESVDEGLRFLTNISNFGIIHENLVLNSVLKILHLGKLGPHDVTRLLEVLSRQRIRLDDSIPPLVINAFGHMTARDKYRTFLNCSSLRISLDPSACLPGLKADPMATTDFLVGMILREDVSKNDKLVESHFIPAAMSLVTALRNENDFAQMNPAWRNKLCLLNSALRFVYPRVMSNAPQELKNLMTVVASSHSEHRHRKGTKAFSTSVSDILHGINLKHAVNVDIGPFQVDIEETAQKIIWTCCDETHFYAGADRKMMTAYHLLRSKILSGMGYKVISLPHWHWTRITSRRLRSEYCLMSRHLIINDSRENQQDDYHGEFIFKKSTPKRSWSWHGSHDVPLRISI
jgi:hypothetical protein